MEYRKLIAFGKSSLIISLPKKWIDSHRLKSGDTVYLLPNQDTITVALNEQNPEKEIVNAVINCDDKNIKHIESEIVIAYLSGASNFEIRGNSVMRDGAQIKKILSDLSGIEIIEQESTKIIARDFLNTNDLSCETLIRRIDLTIRSMFNDSLACVHEDFYESIFHRDLDVNRLVLLTKRVIKTALLDPRIALKLKKNNAELLRDWDVAGELEAIADEIKRTSRYLKGLNTKNKTQYQTMQRQLMAKYLEVMKAYHTNTPGPAFNAHVSHKEQMEEIDKLPNGADAQRLNYHTKGLASHIKDLARAVVN